MTIKVLSYSESTKEYDVGKIEDLAFLLVTVKTGDEIVEVYQTDYVWGDARMSDRFDPYEDDRLRDFLDAVYIVYPEDIESWNERTNTYYYKRVEKDKRLKGMYFNTYDY